VDELHIEINPVDAEQIGVREGELLCVSSRRGEVRGKAKITEKVPPKMVFVPFHFGEAPANALTAAAIDPTSETPAFKISAVRVQKG
jgi:predicted molibdopterin-dependent oxidoreductase YjgC